jgi:hypothetical protein
MAAPGLPIPRLAFRRDGIELDYTLLAAPLEPARAADTPMAALA